MHGAFSINVHVQTLELKNFCEDSFDTEIVEKIKKFSVLDQRKFLTKKKRVLVVTSSSLICQYQKGFYIVLCRAISYRSTIW